MRVEPKKKAKSKTFIDDDMKCRLALIAAFVGTFFFFFKIVFF